MPYDSQATRDRLLVAAIEEFSEKGMAGGRVDRIAAAASANKRAIYDYFGGKEGLFDAALSRVVDELNAANPLLVNDLPEYAARLFDYLHTHPEAVRMTTWWRLERPQLLAGVRSEWFDRLRAASAHTTAGIDSVDLVVLVLGLANAWFLSAHQLLSAVGEDSDEAERLVAHRAAVVEAVRRLAEPRADGA